ncbi:hypothetical protein PHYPO_G00140260 [Pangasianodon hypophthalmus]|uniref:Multiple C2 and transmembrane domain-containing protein 1 n=1 Tax=Pangasianodon hypophthalmus TaxID=310915 RepID=A0A5N5KAM5_PANHP|nr:hypothetical protein PHYPO_G00140260 [Pangasianodon hypophthalmus]
MEEKAKGDSGKEQDATSTSYQRKIWKNFQGRTRPFLSPKLGSERRSADSKKESGLWMFKRKKKPVLDRIFSSSQPNLSSSSPASLQGDEAEPGCSDGAAKSALAALEGATAMTHVYTHEVSVSAHGSPRLGVAHLTASQPKSSSLGSAYFETLVLDSEATSGQDEPSKNASDSNQPKPSFLFCKKVRLGAGIWREQIIDAVFTGLKPSFQTEEEKEMDDHCVVLMLHSCPY